MPYTRFASIANSAKYAYAYDTGYHDSLTGTSPVNEHFRMFETYGDGLTQHSGDWTLQPEFLTDYLLSLAAAMIEDSGLLNDCRWQFNRPEPENVSFAASLVFKPDTLSDWRESKTRYYSKQERKITTASAKQYDKRYEQITKSEDGTPQAIFRLVLSQYPSGLDRLAAAITVYEYVGKQKTGCMEMPAKFCGLTKDHQAARDMRDAFEVCEYVFKSKWLRDCIESRLDTARAAVNPPKTEGAAE